MAISFSVRDAGSILADFSASFEEGLLDTIEHRVAGIMFSQTVVPNVGDYIVFEKSEAIGQRIQGQDVPTWLRTDLTFIGPPTPVTDEFGVVIEEIPGVPVAGVYHIFACSKGTALYQVTAIDDAENLTVLRKWS